MSDLAAIRSACLAERRNSWLMLLGSGVVLVMFAVWTVHSLKIPIARVLGMFGPIARMVSERLMPPNFTYLNDATVLGAVLETLEMSLLGCLLGIVISVPVAWLAAWNVTPNRLLLYPLARAILVIARGVPTLIWAMLMVAILGFGPLAGTLALAKLTIGFAGKLMAEQVEAIDMGPVEAIRATGASEIQVFIYAILPQVAPAWWGIIIYNWDSVFRASSILGFVGAGGLGMYLRVTTQTMEYPSAMAIISLIAVLVVISEVVSDQIRHRLR